MARQYSRSRVGKRSFINNVATFAILSICLAILRVQAIPYQSPDTPNLFTDKVKRSITGNGNELAGQTFDYIIIGGGTSGLVVANRLSEDANITVAVIEAGPDIYGPDTNKFTVPTANLYDSSVGTNYDWQWTTTSQSGLNGRSVPWPRGKIVGGSSAVNGLYMVRASKTEHDMMGELIGAPQRWGWDNMLRAMQKSESFTPPTQAVRAAVPSLQWDASSHGTTGPVQHSWPAVSYPVIESFLQTTANLGTAISMNPYNGQSWGGFLALSCINPANWQRSSARTAYLDGVDQRSNLYVLTGHQVTKIDFDRADPSSVRATGVQYAASRGSAASVIYARREVIVSGGAINSPALLQISGIGDATQLSRLGIDTIVNLPGVGHNVQDHLSTSIVFSPGQNPPPQMPTPRVTGNAQADSYVNSAIAYVNMNTLFGNYSSTLVADLRSNLASIVNSASVSDTVKRAYTTTLTRQVDEVFGSQVGPIELLFALSFGQILIQVALQHPISRGSILISSQNAFDAPSIDAGYLTQDVDLQMLREGFKLARRIGQTAPLSQSIGGELQPGSSVNSDAAWDNWIRNNVGTEYHPSSSCSMLPRDDGGVVDANLLVYGTSNLRVIDASIPPISFSAHLMTIAYGIGEIGAEIIKETRQRQETGQNGPSDPDTTVLATNNTGNPNGATPSASTSILSAPLLLLMTAMIVMPLMSNIL